MTSIDLQAREIKPLRNTYTHVAKYIGGDVPASRYQEATLGAQPTANFHYRPTWDPAHELFDASRSRIRMADWYALRDPRQLYYASWTGARAKQQEAVEASYAFVDGRGLLAHLSDALRESACRVLVPLRHVAWGGNMNNCFVAAYGYGTTLTAAATFHAMDQLAVAQYLTRLGLALDGPAALDAGKNEWLNDACWQGLRHQVEDSFVLKDPMELFVAHNLALDGQLSPLVYGQYVDGWLTPQGGTAVALLTSFMPEWHDESARWVDAVIKVAAAESADNQALLSEWASAWGRRSQASLALLAELALGAQAEAAMAKVRSQYQARCKKIGLSV